MVSLEWRCCWISLCISLAATAIFAVRPASSLALPLPDGRVYELVSPEQKAGGVGGVLALGSLTRSVGQAGRLLQSSSDGGAITYLGEDFYQPQLGGLDQYLSLRGGEGWLTQNLTPPISGLGEPAVEADLYVGASPDLSKGVIKSQVALAAGASAGFANLYLTQNGNIQSLLTGEPPNRSPARTFGHARFEENGVEPTLQFAGGNTGSEDVPPYSHIVFAANDALTQADATAPAAVDGGKLENNLYEWIAGKLRLVNVLPNGETHPNASFGVDYGDGYPGENHPNLDHVISADGSRIFWTDENTGSLYVRKDGERTVQVDAAVGGGSRFQTASVNGAKVFFTKTGSLYQFDTTNGTTSELAGGGVQGLVGTSDDGSYLYFVDSSVLGEGALAGQPNLYLWHEGKTAFIATLSPTDDETPNLYGTVTVYGDWFRTFAGRTAEVSPNGRYIAFMSDSSLTGYDNGTRYEVFLYDASTRELRCASCNTDKSSATSDTLLPAPIEGIYQQRYLTDGGRLFFSTEDAVLPQDTNGKSDLYEYEGGHVYLISPGTADAEAIFADASESGNDVFFTTQQSLVSSDQGEIPDLYDARVGGRREEPEVASRCSGEACHMPTASVLSFGTPPSVVFTGAGNLSSSASPTGGATTKSTALTRLQALARAIKACNHRPKKRRAGCLRQAHTKYGPIRKRRK